MISWMRDMIYVGRQKIGKVLNRNVTNYYGVSQDNSSDNSKKMQVDDTTIFSLSNKHVRLHIVGIDGTVWTVFAPTDICIAVLKSMALSHFYNPVEGPKLQPNFKLVAVSNAQILNPEKTVGEEQLSPEEEILLVEKSNSPEDTPEEIQKGPTASEILEATKHLKTKPVVKIPPPCDCFEDFHTDLRKILISLINAATQLLAVRNDAEKVFESIIEQLESRDKIVPDKNAIKHLTEMGFTKDKVLLALRLKRNNATEALEWLLEKGASKVDLSMSDNSSRQSKQSDEGPSQIKPEPEQVPITEKMKKLLASFSVYRRKEFRPNPEAIQTMIDMGFTEENIVQALKVTGNNRVSACEWLLGDRRPSLCDLDSGLDPEGPIYKALVENPTIQLGLNNPRVLLAFLSILDNPWTLNLWQHDSEAGSVLNQMYRTYHAEKYILSVNSHFETYIRP